MSRSPGTLASDDHRPSVRPAIEDTVTHLAASSGAARTTERPLDTTVGLPRRPSAGPTDRGSGPLAASDLSDDELAARSAEFERMPASKVIQWAVDNFAPHLALTASMTDAVLIDLAVRVDPAVEVVFIDTGYHFDETLETVERVRRHYGLNLRMLTVGHHDEELWKVDPENCCSAVKVGQLDRALAGKSAWMSGLRRVEADSRTTAPIVSRDLRGLVKVNPIATWTDEDVAGYIADHDVIVNPLLEQGYTSIGCQPCTVRPVDPDDPRSGRWAGRARQECGIHQI